MAKTSFYNGSGTDSNAVSALESLKDQAQTSATNAASSATAAASSASTAASNATAAASSATSAAASVASLSTDVATQSANGLMSSADKTKIDGVESGATGDQTAAEIKTAYESNSDTNAFTDALQTKLSGIETGATADQTAAEIKTAYESNSDTNAFTDALQTKLSGIESSADVTDATNVQAAGALMDSEVTSLSGIKTLTVPDSTTVSTFGASLVDDADAAAARTTLGLGTAATTASTAYATAAQGTTADAALPKAGGTMTGAITFASGQTFDGRDVSVDGTKLDTIETNADVTDATNVQAAGALMDSELTSEASVKAINQGLATTDSPSFVSVTVDADPTTSLQLATKSYVDTIAAAGLHYHTPCRVQTTANLSATYDNGSSGVGATLTNSGTQAAISIDGVTLSSADRVLVSEQTNAAHNGIYTVTTVGDGSTNWVLTRATDADSYGPSDPDAFGQGDAFFVKEGSTNAGHLDVMNTEGTITFGTTNITFAEVAETTVYTAGTGLTLTGTVFSANQDISTTASPTFAGLTATGDIDINAGQDIALAGGSGSGLVIQHTGSYGFVRNYTGDLYIYNETNDGDVNILTDNSSGGTTTYIKANGANGEVQLFHYGSERLNTTASGVDISGQVYVTGDIVLEGATADDFETTVTAADPTADRTITLPDQTGTAMLWQSPWPDDPSTDGNRQIAIGDGALQNSTSSAQYNVAVGNFAADALTTGQRVTALGHGAAGALTTGTHNTAVGQGAMVRNTTDSYVTSVGALSGDGDFLTGGTYVGYAAGNYNTASKDYQVAIGHMSMDDNSGDHSTAVGAYSMSDGYHFASVAVGYDALGNSSTWYPYYNVAIGYNAGNGVSAGDNNVLIGNDADVANSSEVYSVAIGSVSRGTSYSVAIGNGACASALDGSDNNVSIGYQAGYDLDGGDYDTFVGYKSGYGGGTGTKNTAVGYQSLLALANGQFNTAIGQNSFSNLTDGGYNVGVGSAVGNFLTTGSNNTFLGINAGYYQDSGATTALTTGSNVTCLGHEAVPSSGTATNEITLGDNDVTSLRCNVQTISSLSDERDKTAIADISYGLDFINDMRPVQFTWNRRDGSLGAKPDIGFIAQELHDVELDHSSSSRTRLVSWENPEKLEADYVRSYPILVKAVQELSAKCDALEARIATLEGN